MVNVSVGDKLTIITHTHVLMCTVTQIRDRDGCCCEEQEQQDQSEYPDQPAEPFQPREPDHRYDFPEAGVLIEVEVQDGVTRR